MVKGTGDVPGFRFARKKRVSCLQTYHHHAAAAAAAYLLATMALIDGLHSDRVPETREIHPSDMKSLTNDTHGSPNALFIIRESEN